jgi:hypothetical protein
MGDIKKAQQIENKHGLSQFSDDHMFGEKGALGKTAMADGTLNPQELQGINKDNTIQTQFVTKVDRHATKEINPKEPGENFGDRKMVMRNDKGIMVPKTNIDEQNIEFYKTSNTNEIQEQLDFCNNIQSLYIDKHEELKTVFALTLNLFQFYSYSLDVIDKLIKAYAEKEVQTGFSLQKNHIIYLPEENKTSYELQISYYSLPERNIKITAEIKHLSDNGNALKAIILNLNIKLIECLTYSEGQAIADNNLILKGNDVLKFNLANLGLEISVYQAIFKSTQTESPVIEYKDSNNNVILHITLITPSIKIISNQSQAPYIPQQTQLGLAAGPGTGTGTGTGTGGEVYFKKITNENLENLKKHQKDLKTQLEILHQFIIDAPKMKKPEKSGGELPIQGGAKKKKKTESININEAIDNLIGGVDPNANILNYHQNEIVEKETGNYYFVDIVGFFESSEPKNVLNLKNNSTNTITFTKLIKGDTSNKFKKHTDSPSTFEENKEFLNFSYGKIKDFKKLEHSEIEKLLGEVNPANLNKPIVFDSEFYKADNKVYTSLFQDPSILK